MWLYKRLCANEFAPTDFFHRMWVLLVGANSFAQRRTYNRICKNEPPSVSIAQQCKPTCYIFYAVQLFCFSVGIQAVNRFFYCYHEIFLLHFFQILPEVILKRGSSAKKILLFIPLNNRAIQQLIIYIKISFNVNSMDGT